MEHTSGVVQEIPHLGINMQRAVPVLTMREVRNVMVHILWYTILLLCLGQKGYSSTMAWCCSHFRCSCPIDHTTSLGFPEDCRHWGLQWTPTDNVFMLYLQLSLLSLCLWNEHHNNCCCDLEPQWFIGPCDMWNLHLLLDSPYLLTPCKTRKLELTARLVPMWPPYR